MTLASIPCARPRRARPGLAARMAGLALLALAPCAAPHAGAPALTLPAPPGIDAELARPPELGSYVPASRPTLPDNLRRPAPEAAPRAPAPPGAAAPDRVQAIRDLLRAGRRDDAMLALEALRREQPDLAIPPDLRALLPARAGAS